MKKLLGKTQKTARGFAYIEFTDIYERPCTIQKSSLADMPALWLGVDDGSSSRMHVDKMLAQRIVYTLNRWIKTGRL